MFARPRPAAAAVGRRDALPDGRRDRRDRGRSTMTSLGGRAASGAAVPPGRRAVTGGERRPGRLPGPAVPPAHLRRRGHRRRRPGRHASPSPARASTRVAGYDPQLLVGRPMAEFLHPDDLGVAVAAARDAGGRDRAPGRCQPMRVRIASGEWVADERRRDGRAGGRAVRRGGGHPPHGSTARPRSSGSCGSRLVNEGRLVRLASAFVNLPADQLDDGRRHRARGDGRPGRRRPGRGRAVRPGVERHDQHPRVGRARGRAAAPATRAHAHARHPAAPGPAPPRGGQHPVDRARSGSAWEAEQAWFDVSRRALGPGRAARPTRASSSGSSASRRSSREWTFEAGHVTTLRARPASSPRRSPGPRSRRQLAYQARHDPLTDLPNRWAFLEATARARRPARSRAAAAAPGPRRAAVRPRPLQGDQRLARPQRRATSC